MADLSERLQASLPGLLAFELKTLPAAVVVLLLKQLPHTLLTDGEWQDIEDVATAHRDPTLARAAVQSLARAASHSPLAEAEQQAHLMVSAWAFQNLAPESAHHASVQALRLAVSTLTEPVKQAQYADPASLCLTSAGR